MFQAGFQKQPSTSAYGGATAQPYGGAVGVNTQPVYAQPPVAPVAQNASGITPQSLIELMASQAGTPSKLLGRFNPPVKELPDELFKRLQTYFKQSATNFRGIHDIMAQTERIESQITKAMENARLQGAEFMQKVESNDQVQAKVEKLRDNVD